MGRKTILSDSLIKLFITNIATGVRRSSAGAMAGISEASIYNWINKGVEAIEDCEKSETPKEDHEDCIFIEFYEKLNQAEAELERELIQEVHAEPGGARWLLGHSPRFRRSYGNSLEVNLHTDGDDLQYELNWPDADKMKMVSQEKEPTDVDGVLLLEEKNP